MWALPGGMVDDGESSWHALRREFTEEAVNIDFAAERSQQALLDRLFTKPQDSTTPLENQVGCLLRLLTCWLWLRGELRPHVIDTPTGSCCSGCNMQDQTVVATVYQGYVDDPRNTDNAVPAIAWSVGIRTMLCLLTHCLWVYCCVSTCLSGWRPTPRCSWRLLRR